MYVGGGVDDGDDVVDGIVGYGRFLEGVGFSCGCLFCGFVC